jgi:hypothetical protein
LTWASFGLQGDHHLSNPPRQAPQTPVLNMYKENAKSINWFVGCEHDCVYCKPSFQRQMRRQKKRCIACFNYRPHSHLERLLKPPPTTLGKDFVFFPSSGDPAFATDKEWQRAIDYTREYPKTTFLIQSKDPAFFLPHKFPDNVILGTTVETDLLGFHIEKSDFHYYVETSKATYPIHRIKALLTVIHPRKFVTVEPILDFGGYFADLLRMVKPEFIYVGYDNHGCKLPEPELARTLALIEQLKKFTEVRVKTLRKAWWEE